MSDTARKDFVLPLIVGLGAGTAVGYVAGSMGGGARPIITLSRYSIPVGSAYTVYFQNFPPNAQIVGIQALNPLTIVNLGMADANGKLQLNATAQGHAGQYAIIAYSATPNGPVAMTTFNTT